MVSFLFQALGRMLDARQLGLKLIANVTYGYTSAHFSGRMPCVEVRYVKENRCILAEIKQKQRREGGREVQARREGGRERVRVGWLEGGWVGGWKQARREEGRAGGKEGGRKEGREGTRKQALREGVEWIAGKETKQVYIIQI